MKKVLFSAALLMAAATVSFAGTPKEAKDAKPEAKTEVKKTEPVVKWFHFTGNASLSADLQNPAKYDDEITPTCSNPNDTYRCDIKILTMEGDDSQPDLSQPILDERKRATAN